MLIHNDLYLSDIDHVILNQKSWSDLDQKSFLVVGASGMIGTFLVDVLT